MLVLSKIKFLKNFNLSLLRLRFFFDKKRSKNNKKKNLTLEWDQIFIVFFIYIRFTTILTKADESIAIVSQTATQMKIRIAFLSVFVSPHEVMASYQAYAVNHMAITENDRQRFLLIKLMTEKMVLSLPPSEELMLELCSVDSFVSQPKTFHTFLLWLILKSSELSLGSLTSIAKIIPMDEIVRRIEKMIFFIIDCK